MAKMLNIKSFFKKAAVGITPQTDEKVWANILAAYNNQQSKKTSTKRGLENIKMYKYRFKLAAAAVILTVLIFFTQYDKAGIAWADVIKQISEFRPYTCKMTFVYDGDRPSQSHIVMHLTLSKRREIRDEGRLIQVFDMSQKPIRILQLYPEKKFARETLLLDEGPIKDPDMLRMIAGCQNGNAIGLDKINGKTVQIFQSPPNIHNEFTVWADVKTSLPQRVEIRQDSASRTIIMEDFEFAPEIDESLFDTNAPEDYTLDKVEKGGTETVIGQEDLVNVDFNTFIFSSKPSWTKEPLVMKMTNVMGIEGDIYISYAVAKDSRHIVLMQSKKMSEMLLDKIRNGQLIYTTSSGLKVYRGGPEKWYSNILLESVGNALPDKPSPDRTGCAIESPSGEVILLAFNALITDDEINDIAELLVPVKNGN